jgi:hypothetical protein
MTQQVLFHYLVEGAVTTHDQEEELQEHGLDIGKQQDRDEGQAQDHHHQDEVDNEKEQRVVLIYPSQGCQVVHDTSQYDKK